MEASDNFGAGVESPEGDPFAETSMSEFDQSDTDPLADPAEEPKPLVDREGNVIEERSDAEAPVESAEEEAMRISAEEELAEQEAAAPATLGAAPTAGDQTAPSAEAAEALDTGAGSEPSAENPGGAPVHGPEGDAVDPQAADGPASSATPASDPEIPSSPAARDAAAPAASPSDAGPTDASATQKPAPATDDGHPATDDSGEKLAPVPEELKDKSGAITHRRYIILTPEGTNGKHKEVTWFEDKNGQMVKKGTAGAKKQSVALARGQEDALAIGYRALGEPEGGVPLRAVAYTYWGELVHVEPKYDAPVRQRLTFRR